jgi:hypothetical protein
MLARDSLPCHVSARFRTIHRDHLHLLVGIQKKRGRLP